MPNNKIQPVILCGGSGTRLWPLSRAGFPKQFLHLFDSESLFQLTLKRLAKFTSSSPMVVGNEAHRFLILDQALEVGLDPADILLEPVGRNTAPTLALAALATKEEGDDPILVVTPADHTVANVAAFVETLSKAVEIADSGAIVTLGIIPNAPETGYGYLCTSQDKVEAFIEKPDRETATRYLNGGRYYWNSGIFVVKASIWLDALQQFCPDILQAASVAWTTRQNDSVFIRPGRAEFEAIPSKSIDYAVMEKCPGIFDVRMLPLMLAGAM